jgi:hypothetical protein
MVEWWVARENWIIVTEIFSSTTSPATNLSSNYQGLNPSLRGEKLASVCLSYATVQVCDNTLVIQVTACGRRLFIFSTVSTFASKVGIWITEFEARVFRHFMVQIISSVLKILEALMWLQLHFALLWLMSDYIKSRTCLSSSNEIYRDLNISPFQFNLSTSIEINVAHYMPHVAMIQIKSQKLSLHMHEAFTFSVLSISFSTFISFILLLRLAH